MYSQSERVWIATESLKQARQFNISAILRKYSSLHLLCRFQKTLWRANKIRETKKKTKRCSLQNRVSLFSPCSLASQLQTPKSMVLLQETLKSKIRSLKLLRRSDTRFVCHVVCKVFTVNFSLCKCVHVLTFKKRFKNNVKVF